MHNNTWKFGHKLTSKACGQTSCPSLFVFGYLVHCQTATQAVFGACQTVQKQISRSSSRLSSFISHTGKSALVQFPCCQVKRRCTQEGNSHMAVCTQSTSFEQPSEVIPTCFLRKAKRLVNSTHIHKNQNSLPNSNTPHLMIFVILHFCMTKK